MHRLTERNVRRQTTVFALTTRLQPPPHGVRHDDPSVDDDVLVEGLAAVAGLTAVAQVARRSEVDDIDPPQPEVMRATTWG